MTPSRAVAAAGCAFVVSACSVGGGGPAPRNGGTIHVALPAAPASLNPLVARDEASQLAYAPLFPLLYAAQADLSVGPSLATSLPSYSASGTTVTVPLRTDAHWSDGVPITADDVVYTITTEMNPALPASSAYDWGAVANVVKADDHTVRFTLHAADAAFVANSLVTPIVPAHVLQRIAPAQMAAAPYSSAPTVSGGPFLFSKRTGDTLTYDANGGFFLGRPHADHVVAQIAPAPNAAPDALGSGAVSWDPTMSAAAAGQAVISSGVSVASYPDLAIVALQFNVRAGHPFAASNVRQALAMSLDHDGIVGRATGASQGFPVWGDINPASWAFSAPKQYTQDPEAAKRLLSGAHPAGTIVFPQSDQQRGIAAASVAQEAQNAGFAVVPHGLSDSDFQAALSSGSFDIAVVALPQGVDPDDSSFLATGAPLNAGGYSNHTLDTLLGSELSVTSGNPPNLQQARKPVFAQIEQLVSTDLPLYFLWMPRHYMGFSATLAGVAGAGVQLDAARANSFYVDWFLIA